jgi:hypothetical protein
MSVRHGIVLLLALSTLSLLVGCGNNGNAAAVPPPSGKFGNSNLTGTYVFSVSGLDTNGAGYAMVGAMIADGSGKITGGTVDIVDQELTPAFNLAISNGTYSVGVDGRGQAIIATSSANPFGTSLTFDFVLANSSQGLITEFDSNASGSGTLDLQTANLTQASLAGPYAFSFSGVDPGGSGSFATAGAFTLDANGNIVSGTGVEDFNDNGLLPSSDQTLTGQVILGPSSTPASALNAGPNLFTYDVYAINATHLKFIEIGQVPVLVGDAFSQPSATIATGPMAFTLAGLTGGNPSALGGFMVTDGAGNITNASTEDININGTTGSGVSFSATYAASGPGRFELSNFAGFAGGSAYAAYPSSGGLLMLEIDGAGITSGAAFPQSTTAFGAASQGYGLNLTGINTVIETEGGPPEEVDDVAEFIASGTGDTCDAAGDTVCGILDENVDPAGSSIGAPTSDLPFSQGAWGPIDATGRYGLAAAAGNTNLTSLNGGFNLVLYAVDGNTFPFMEQDGNQISTGIILLQNPAAATPATAHSRMFIARPLLKPHVDRSKKK